MLFVRAGSVDGDHEEILNGYVYQSDRSGILASWRGVDPESQVKSYWVAVGSQPRKNSAWFGNNMVKFDLQIINLFKKCHHFS